MNCRPAPCQMPVRNMVTMVGYATMEVNPETVARRLAGGLLAAGDAAALNGQQQRIVEILT